MLHGGGGVRCLHVRLQARCLQAVCSFDPPTTQKASPGWFLLFAMEIQRWKNGGGGLL